MLVQKKMKNYIHNKEYIDNIIRNKHSLSMFKYKSTPSFSVGLQEYSRKKNELKSCAVVVCNHMKLHGHMLVKIVRWVGFILHKKSSQASIAYCNQVVWLSRAMWWGTKLQRKEF